MFTLDQSSINGMETASEIHSTNEKMDTIDKMKNTNGLKVLTKGEVTTENGTHKRSASSLDEANPAKIARVENGNEDSSSQDSVSLPSPISNGDVAVSIYL